MYNNEEQRKQAVKALAKRYLSPAKKHCISTTTYGAKHWFQRWPVKDASINLYVDVNTFNEIMEELGFKLLDSWKANDTDYNNKYGIKWNREALKEDGLQVAQYDARIEKVN